MNSLEFRKKIYQIETTKELFEFIVDCDEKQYSFAIFTFLEKLLIINDRDEINLFISACKNKELSKSHFTIMYNMITGWDKTQDKGDILRLLDNF